MIHAALGLGFFILFVILLVLVFEIWMFVDVVTNDRIPSDRKVLWALGMLIIHPFVAIAYFFTDHKA